MDSYRANRGMERFLNDIKYKSQFAKEDNSEGKLIAKIYYDHINKDILIVREDEKEIYEQKFIQRIIDILKSKIKELDAKKEQEALQEMIKEEMKDPIFRHEEQPHVNKI